MGPGWNLATARAPGPGAHSRCLAGQATSARPLSSEKDTFHCPLLGSEMPAFWQKIFDFYYLKDKLFYTI